MSTANDAYRAWLDTEPGLHATHEEAFMFAYRRALEDAADAWNRGQWSRHYAIPKQSTPAVEKWLRDRAAGVGTKDGDDDE